MYYYVEGTVAHTEPNIAVVDCGGVGYLCHVSLHTASRLSIGARARLYTYLNVKEDALDLFGFFDREELYCFKLLYSITGVGPKVALGLLSSLTPERLALAIITGDEKALCAAPGVGRKLVQRLILELKDKLAKENPAVLGSVSDGFSPAASSNKSAEALMALSVLGYTQTEALSVLRSLDCENMTLENIIKEAIKNLAKVNR